MGRIERVRVVSLIHYAMCSSAPCLSYRWHTRSVQFVQREERAGHAAGFPVSARPLRRSLTVICAVDRQTGDAAAVEGAPYIIWRGGRPDRTVEAIRRGAPEVCIRVAETKTLILRSPPPSSTPRRKRCPWGFPKESLGPCSLRMTEVSSVWNFSSRNFRLGIPGDEDW
jgi:hypothetical protein